MLTHSKKIDAYIKGASSEKRLILEKVRAIILRTLPEVTEVFKYNVPYYNHVCYLSQQGEGVYINFCYGYLLPKKYHIKKGRGRFVRHYVISSVRNIKPRILQELLRSAYRKRVAGGLLKKHTRQLL